MRIAPLDLPSDFDPSPIRVWSLIATFFGDAVLPRGGQIWLGTVTELFSTLAIEAEAVRAAMSRLARDGFLERERAGRTSHYALSADAARQSRTASALIYRRTAASARPGWSVTLVDKPSAKDLADLSAAGFLMVGPGVFARPGAGTTPPLGVGLNAAGQSLVADRELSAKLCALGEIDARYRSFLKSCAAVSAATRTFSPRDAMALRLVLVHTFRRIVLRDPHLHPRALPTDWPADRAHAAFADLYQAVYPVAEEWLDHHGHNARGPLPAASDPQRFANPAHAEM